MNWLDIVIAIVLAISAFVGLKSGIIKIVISIAGLILGIFLAGRFYQGFADKLTFISSGTAAEITAYIIILVVVMAAAAVIAWLLSRLLSDVMLGWLNRLGGAILGAIIAGIFVGAVLAVWAKYGGGGDTTGNSFLAKFLLDKFPLVLALLPDEFDSVRSFFK